MNFMSKKANMRQNSIITLSDQNKQEIQNLKEQKESIMKEFETKKQSMIILYVLYVPRYFHLYSINIFTKNYTPIRYLQAQSRKR